jgi:hypothetical protein
VSEQSMLEPVRALAPVAEPVEPVGDQNVRLEEGQTFFAKPRWHQKQTVRKNRSESEICSPNATLAGAYMREKYPVPD